jgi:CBS domain containing-hemolysin-like protein
MTSILVLLIGGLVLSALFSGSEIGFYRIPRVRLRLDALEGDVVARGLLWLTKYPTLFVATTLIGNNIANYCSALAIVMLVEYSVGDSAVMQIVAPIVFAPILFVYGELLPKTLFFHMPFRLLRRWAPLLAFFAVLFSPISGLLSIFARFLQHWGGALPERLSWRLARGELTSMLDQGHQAGILRPCQKQLAQGIFSLASRPVTEFAVSPKEFHSIAEGTSRETIIDQARRFEQAVLPVHMANDPSQWIGYLNVPELYVEDATQPIRIHPMVEIAHRATHLATLMKLQRADQSLGRIVGQKEETLGFITPGLLCDPLFQGEI